MVTFGFFGTRLTHPQTEIDFCRFVRFCVSFIDNRGLVEYHPNFLSELATHTAQSTVSLIKEPILPFLLAIVTGSFNTEFYRKCLVLQSCCP